MKLREFTCPNKKVFDTKILATGNSLSNTTMETNVYINVCTGNDCLSQTALN